MYKILHVGRCKDRNHVIISIDVQNVFAKVLHFTTTTTTTKKALKTLGIIENHISIIKTIHNKPLATIC